MGASGILFLSKIDFFANRQVYAPYYYESRMLIRHLFKDFLTLTHHHHHQKSTPGSNHRTHRLNCEDISVLVCRLMLILQSLVEKLYQHHEKLLLPIFARHHCGIFQHFFAIEHPKNHCCCLERVKR